MYILFEIFLYQVAAVVVISGNAIGYVRLVRSGCLHCISSATQFIPDLQQVTSFEEMCQTDKIHDRTVDAARNLDNVLNNLTGYFHKETDYFQVHI